ncbi:MAG: quinone-dependent dihydroorotate dehydrogenase [Verrucomicrobia bacterium]|nr:quinone-dependent dihydroorotate dehydrogenase [Verrucomicrobiota bacterium]
MSIYTSLVRPLLFRFEPETAHRFTLAALRVPGLARLLVPRKPPVADKVSLMGLTFRNRLGIAAGVDKNGDAPLAWRDLGFGFAELGTVTYHPQPGNPRPRVFRYPSERALVNRLGFPNIGAKAFASRLRRLRTRQAVYDFPIGINLGKSKVTPLPDAPSDYLGSLKILHALGDFFVINISSPNTAGLRDLAQPDDLRRLLSALQEFNRSTSDPKPLLLKISPDSEDRYLPDLVAITREFQLAGIVATNTTSQRTPENPHEAGGLSGHPLTHRALTVARIIRPLLARDQILIGVGGVMDSGHYRLRRQAGADLVQMYTGLVYLGPTAAWDILGRS